MSQASEEEDGRWSGVPLMILQNTHDIFEMGRSSLVEDRKSDLLE